MMKKPHPRLRTTSSNGQFASCSWRRCQASVRRTSLLVNWSVLRHQQLTSCIKSQMFVRVLPVRPLSRLLFPSYPCQASVRQTGTRLRTTSNGNGYLVLALMVCAETGTAVHLHIQYAGKTRSLERHSSVSANTLRLKWQKDNRNWEVNVHPRFHCVNWWHHSLVRTTLDNCEWH